MSRNVLRLPAGTKAFETLVNRVGIRMYVSVRPGGAPRSNFTIGSLTAGRWASGDPVVVADVRNTGQRTLDINGSLALSRGPGGVRTGLLPVTLAAPLGPGGSERVTVQLDKHAPGARRCGSEADSLDAPPPTTITFPSGATAATGPPMALLVTTGLLVLLAVAALGLLVIRRPNSRSAASGRNVSAT